MLYETLLTRDEAERYRAAGWWPDRLLNDYLDQAVARDPAKTALVDPRGRRTYAELREQADRCALALLDLGIRHGDAVTVQLPNWNEFVVLTLALEQISAVINPVAPIFRQNELRAMLHLARPVAAVLPARFRGWDYPAMYQELRAETPSLRTLIVVGAAAGEAIHTWDALLQRGGELLALRPALVWLRPGPDDVTELIFTSGTTGEPKGVLHTPNTLASAVDATIRAQHLHEGDVFHMASTFGHQTGFLYGVRAPIQVGARAVYQDIWDPVAFIDLIETERITFSMGATPFVADTLAALEGSARDVSSLRVFVTAGAPIPRPLAEAVSRRMSCRLVPGWGMSENALVTAVAPHEPAERVTTTDGRPYPGMEVTVRGPDGSELPAGEEGDLYARGAFSFAGYIQGRQFSQQFLTPDGWFSTGDRARMDRDGYIRISGRSKDIIIRGGENVPVKQIEDVLLRHPKVHGIALIGLPDARLGEIGCACVLPEPGEALTLDELRAFLAEQQVTRQFWPERLALLAEFPMTPSGKIQKFRLRELLSAPAVVLSSSA